MRTLTKLAMILALVGSVAVLHAQSAPPAIPVAPEAPKSAALSAAEMQVKVARHSDEIDANYRKLLHFQELAKKQKDVIKLSCVNDRLIHVKARMNSAESTRRELDPALATNSDERFALFTEYVETAEAINNLRAEADICIGVPELSQQESGVIVNRPEILDDPTVQNPFDLAGTFVEIEAPAYASPFN